RDAMMLVSRNAFAPGMRTSCWRGMSPCGRFVPGTTELRTGVLSECPSVSSDEATAAQLRRYADSSWSTDTGPALESRGNPRLHALWTHLGCTLDAPSRGILALTAARVGRRGAIGCSHCARAKPLRHWPASLTSPTAATGATSLGSL